MEKEIYLQGGTCDFLIEQEFPIPLFWQVGDTKTYIAELESAGLAFHAPFTMGDPYFHLTVIGAEVKKWLTESEKSGPVKLTLKIEFQ
jgi:hypothetical protein